MNFIEAQDPFTLGNKIKNPQIDMCSGRLHALGAAVVITTCYNEAAGGDLP